MEFRTLNEAIRVNKKNGTTVDYYIFDEMEIHLNKISPHTLQEWHYHQKISETILVTKGKLGCKWLENNQEKSKYLNQNELVQVGSSKHTFFNDSDEIVEFVVFRFVPDGINKHELIKNDKVMVENE